MSPTSRSVTGEADATNTQRKELPMSCAIKRFQAAATFAASSLLLTVSLPAMAETVSRLLDVATGKELERDVVWGALSLDGKSSRVETEFVNGLREK